VVDVGIVDPKGAKDTIRPVITKKSADLWYVEYTAFIPGLHSVNVFFAGKQINNSPFPVGVAAGQSASRISSTLCLKKNVTLFIFVISLSNFIRFC